MKREFARLGRLFPHPGHAPGRGEKRGEITSIMMPAGLVTLGTGTGLMSLERLGIPLLQRGILRRMLSFTPNWEVLDPIGGGSLTIVERFYG